MPFLKSLKTKFDLPLQFWIIALIAFINSVSFTIIIPLLYPYAREFGLTDFQASLLTTSYAVSQFLATPVLGRFSDFIGRKPLLIISLIGTVIANLLASFTPVAGLLYVARILDGLTGGNMSIARAVISDTTTIADRPKAFGLFDAAFRMGFVTGPAISYLALNLPPFPGVSSLGMSFFVGALFAALAVGLSVFLLPETLPVREPLKLAVAALEDDLNVKPSGSRSNHPFIQQCLKLNWEIFGFGKILRAARHPKLGRVYFLTFLTGFTFTIFTFAFQPFLLNVLNQNAKTLAMLFILIGVVSVLTQIFAVEPLTKRFNLANILSVAIAGRALVFLLIPTFPNLPMFVVLVTFLGMMNSFPMPLIDTILSTNSSDREQGKTLGINSSYLSIANALGPATAGLLVSFSYSTPFWVTGILTLLIAGFALTLKSAVNCGRRSGIA